MSEKKTAEIKFRIEPSVKAFWQAQAADETEDNLSELITKAVNQYVHWAKENARLDGTKLLDVSGTAYPRIVVNPEVPEDEMIWVVDSDGVVARRSQPLVIIKNVTDCSPANPALLPPRHDWTFEGRNG